MKLVELSDKQRGQIIRALDDFDAKRSIAKNPSLPERKGEGYA